MPYASHIQLVNDPNGTAYAFLADNGAIWQCQWDAQAGGWVKGQVVPQAFGGEKLQALYLDNLWPTSGGDNPDFNPGIVLAYRLGEGSSAEVWASFGTWAGDGTLQWMAPQQLTKDQVDDQTFSLVEGVAGGFDLVVQKKEAGAGSSTTLDKQNAASTADLQAMLQADISGARPDSDLYVNQYKLQIATDPTPGVVLNYFTANQQLSVADQQLSAAIQSAVIQTPKAAAPLALSGDTQLSRQQLIVPLSTNPTALQASQSTTQAGVSWGGGATGQLKGGSLRFGALVGQNIMRWEANIPANYNAYRQQEANRVEYDSNDSRQILTEKEYSGGTVDLENSFDQQDTFKNSDEYQSSLMESQSDFAKSTLDQASEDMNIGIDSNKLSKSVRIFSRSEKLTGLGGLFDIFASSRTLPSDKVEGNIKWRGAFGIGNFGARGLTSVSSAKIIAGIGNEDSGQMLNSIVNNNGIIGGENPFSIVTGNFGIGGSSQTIYQYSNRMFQSPVLTDVIARESVGVDLSRRSFRFSTVTESTIRTAASWNIGYEATQTLSSEKLPTWLASIGYVSGALGKGERLWMTYAGAKGRNKEYKRNNYVQKFGLGGISGGEGLPQLALANTVVGSLTSFVGPASILGLALNNSSALSGAQLDHSSGFQTAGRLTAAWLYSAIAGI
jgi:hypothetical protein